MILIRILLLLVGALVRAVAGCFSLRQQGIYFICVVSFSAAGRK
jgi:hypothetical protein